MHSEDSATALQARDGLQGPGRSIAGWGEGAAGCGARTPPGYTGQLCVCSSPSLSAGRTVQAWPPPPAAPAASTVPPRKAHSRVSMTQGLDADKHPHGVPSPRPRPALRLPAVCGDRHACSSPPGAGGQSREGQGLDSQVQAQERPSWRRLSPQRAPWREVGMEACLQGDPGLGAGPHSPTCRLAENWKMAVTGAVNRPEARLKPEPRRKAPWAVGWRDSR